MTDRIYFDTCVYVVVFKGGDAGYPERLEQSLAALDAAQRGVLEPITSTLTIAEVFGSPLTGGHVPRPVKEQSVEKAETYFRAARETLVELDEELSYRASRIAQQHHLKGGDAVHAASALRAGCSRLFTWDKDLLKIGSLEGIQVCQPAVGLQGTLEGT